MNTERNHSLWINWSRRIVSFRKEAGFEELQYSTYEEKLHFAVEKGFEGFLLQLLPISSRFYCHLSLYHITIQNRRSRSAPPV